MENELRNTKLFTKYESDKIEAEVWEENAEENSWTEEAESNHYAVVPYDRSKAFSKASFPQRSI